MHEGALLRYAARLLRDHDAAQDAVQEAFIRYVRYLQKPGCKDIELPAAWLYRTTRNLCLDRLRLLKTKMEVLVDELPEHPELSESPEHVMAKNEEHEIVRTLINKLEPRDREVLILKVEHGKTYKEIAEIMKLSVGNVGFILHNTIKRLQQERQETIADGRAAAISE